MLIWLKKQNMIKHENLSLHIKMGKEILTFKILKYWNWKKINFTGGIRLLFFFFFVGGGEWHVGIENVLLSKKNGFLKGNCNYFIGYLYNDHKIKPLNIKLHKTKF